VNDGVDLTPFGLAVGHATDDVGATGLTVIRGIDGPLRAAAVTVGRATGSRELHAASPEHGGAGRVDAVMLTGGSAYGLDAAAGVMRWLAAKGRGVSFGQGLVPIVPAAVIFDLGPLGRFDAHPTDAMAFDATDRATPTGFGEGSIGAGTGATVGKVLGPTRSTKGGFGCAIESLPDVAVAAMVVVNAFGDVRDAVGTIIAGARAPDGGFADAMRVLQRAEIAPPETFEEAARRNTTLAVVASSTPLTALELSQLARAASAALYRRITPCGSSVDGDVVFAVSPESGQRWSFDVPGRRRPLAPMIIEALAVGALERAIERAVRLARGRDGIPGLADS
jgi:L-aminopeptidase/D-esterase-like protein